MKKPSVLQAAFCVDANKSHKDAILQFLSNDLISRASIFNEDLRVKHRIDFDGALDLPCTNKINVNIDTNRIPDAWVKSNGINWYLERDCTKDTPEFEYDPACEIEIDPRDITFENNDRKISLNSDDIAAIQRVPNTLTNRWVGYEQLYFNDYLDRVYTPTDLTYERLSHAAWNPQISQETWHEMYYPRFLEWRNKARRPPMTQVPLKIHTLVEPLKEKVDGIASVGMEVEIDPEWIPDDFYDYKNDEHPDRSSHWDGSDPREIASDAYTDEYKLFEFWGNFHYIQEGSCGRYSCGSHFHIAPKNFDFNIMDQDRDPNQFYYETYRNLVGVFSPFFAGSRPKNDNEFMFRKDIWQWAKFPPEESKAEWSDKLRRGAFGSKGYAVYPHKKSGKPLTFEFRLNEAIPQSALTGINLMTRFVDAFIGAKVYPKFPTNMGNVWQSIVNGYGNVSFDRLKFTIDDEPTKQVMAKVLGRDLQKEESLYSVLETFKENAPLKNYESVWIDRVLDGKTWGSIIFSSNDQRDRVGLTRKYVREFTPLQERSDTLDNFDWAEIEEECSCDQYYNDLSNYCSDVCLDDCNCNPDNDCDEMSYSCSSYCRSESDGCYDPDDCDCDSDSPYGSRCEELCIDEGSCDCDMLCDDVSKEYCVDHCKATEACLNIDECDCDADNPNKDDDRCVDLVCGETCDCDKDQIPQYCFDGNFCDPPKN